MSMIGNFLLLEDRVIEDIKKGELSSCKVIMDILENSNDSCNKGKILDIDKTWHAIHFTLTGELDEGDDDNILSKIIFNDTPLSEEEIGYGPAILIDKKEVAKISKELCKITEQEFRSRFNIDEMADTDIYPVQEGDDEEEFFEYVYPYFKELQTFFGLASQQNSCIVYLLT